MAHSTAILCISVMEKGEGETGKGGEDLLSPPPASRLSDFRSTTATSLINLSEQCIQMLVSFYGTVHESVETNSGGGPRRNRIVDPAKEILLLSPPSFAIFSLPPSIHFSSPLPFSLRGFDHPILAPYLTVSRGCIPCLNVRHGQPSSKTI